MAVASFDSWGEFLVYITFLFFGLSVMMVSNSIMAAPSFITEYYKYAQGDPDVEADDPSFWFNILTYYNVAVFGTQTVCQMFMLTPAGRSIPLRPRLIAGLLIPFGEILALILVPVGGATETGAKATVMVIAIVSGISKTLCDSTTNALAGPFPTKFYGAYVWGLGVSGILSSTMSIIIKASMADDFDSVQTQSRIYFGVAMGLQLVSCVLLIIMPRNPFARKYTAEFRYAHDHRHVHNNPDAETPEDNMQVKSDSNEDLVEPVNEGNDNLCDGRKVNVLNAEGDADKMHDIDQVDNITSTQQMLNAHIWTVFLAVWPMLMACFVVFGATLLVFPGVFFAVKTDNDWYLTVIIAMFNIGDFISRFLLLFKRLQPSPRVVLYGTFLRTLVVPPLVLCVRGIIPGIALPYILSLIWGLTNGYFGGMGMIHAPRTPSLVSAGQRSLAGIMASVGLLLGLFAGSSLALAVKEGFPE
ncbi:putative nucleoside transporter 1 [Trypanosoma grayi]|uniref:putative nucleoside transporter 1 n=1 Tax=Trypanosoma grayi TaxID=71804 RepID=UPI0004F42DC2|nr:putative nucleoside transporter 1 [Trypanosoma grayi]KEG05995.1 putative nucleoside transporter 1 [Trypanosoma grayi]